MDSSLEKKGLKGDTKVVRKYRKSYHIYSKGLAEIGLVDELEGRF